MKTLILPILLTLLSGAFVSNASAQFALNSPYTASLNMLGDTVGKRLSFTVTCTEQIQSVAIVGRKGKQYLSMSPPGGPSMAFSMSIPISKLPDGTYWVQAESNSGFISRKFAVKRADLEE